MRVDCGVLHCGGGVKTVVSGGTPPTLSLQAHSIYTRIARLGKIDQTQLN
jgi:hypothetical protein